MLIRSNIAELVTFVGQVGYDIVYGKGLLESKITRNRSESRNMSDLCHEYHCSKACLFRPFSFGKSR